MSGSGRTNLAAGIVVALLTCAVLWPIVDGAFLNWDDDAIFLRNPALTGPHVYAWAFTTTHMGHYQPLSWIAWSALAQTFGVNPTPFHLLNLLTHGIVTALVFLLAMRLLLLAGVTESRARIAAAAGALLFGIHPMRVEPVAWASAFPYLAALLFALLSTLAYVGSRSRPWREAAALKGPRYYRTPHYDRTPRYDRSATLSGSPFRRYPTLAAVEWSVAAVAAFAVSLGFRPIAVGLPLILLLLDWYPLQAAHRQAGRDRALPLIADKIPYVVIALAAVGLEWYARRQVGFNELTPGARLTLAATGPFVYLWRAVAPVGLSPVAVLPLNVQGSILGVICATAIGVIVAVGWGLRDRRPAVLAVWVAYLLLVAPTVGLAPTGLQAVADRYAYLPAVAVAVAAAAALAVAVSNRPVGLTIAAAALLGLSVLAWNQTHVWHDSVTLWTRAAQLDAANDIAFYNLGTALQDAGRSDEAISAYEATLRLVPDHVPARQNLNGLKAIARQRDADALAGAGNLAAAIPLYRETLTLDPRRARARAALGVALARTGQFQAAADELARAIDQGVDDPAVVNAAGFALVQTGRTDEAVRLLREALARHPDDPNIAHNLELLTGTKK